MAPMVRVLRLVTLALTLAFSAAQPLSAQQADRRVADLVEAGRVRVGLGVVAPHWAVKDPQTGELRGIAVDLARAFATRLGVAFEPVIYPSPPAILEGIATEAWDVAFLGIDPTRATVVDFSPPYLRIDATYLVPAGSPVRSIADADQPGIRIAVSRRSVEEIVLSGTLKLAQLQAVDTVATGFDLLRGGDVDLFAAPRPTLLQFAAKLAGSRVLEERFHATYAGMVVPKHKPERLAYISEFIEEAKSSGLVQQAIERAGVRGVEVVPLGAGTP